MEEDRHCLQCGKPIKPKRKFCSVSCSAFFVNKDKPRKRGSFLIPIDTCKICGSQIPENKERREKKDKLRTQLTVCRQCKDRAGNFSKGSVLSRDGSRREHNVTITKHSRRMYSVSGRPRVCAECGYSLHVDICHVKSVESFTDSDLLRDINDEKNLVALCKNHHWEFDHGILPWNPDWR